MTWRVVLTLSARKQLEALSDRDVTRVADRLRHLAVDPLAASKALKGGGFRLRVGDLRILYDLLKDELVVLVVEVGHRRDVCRRH